MGRKRILNKRKQYHFYATPEEYETICDMARSIHKTAGNTVRICSLAVAADPSLQYIFDHGVLLKPTDSNVALKKYIYQHIDSIINMLIEQGIELQEISEEDGDEHEQ